MSTKLKQYRPRSRAAGALLMLIVLASPSHARGDAVVTTSQEIAARIPYDDRQFNALHATKAARRWLNLLDQKAYQQAWKTASVTVRQHIAETSFINQASTQRDPLGAMVKRRIRTSLPQNQLQDGPKGSYLIATFITQFVHKANVTEIVLLQVDADRQWRVAGYFLQNK